MLLKFYIGTLAIILFSSETLSNSTNTVNNETENYPYYPAEKWSEPFDWQLLKTFSTLKYRNILISPISLKLVLALLYEGSGGITQKEFQNVLDFPQDKKVLRNEINQTLAELQSTEKDEYILKLGTRIFLDSNIPPQQNYAAKAEHNYQTLIHMTNYSDTVNASRSINSWISNTTNGHISHLVHPDDIQNAVMLIANAIFFKGIWHHKFPKNQTKLGGFYVSPNEIVDVPYMRTVDDFFYHESTDLDSKIIRLPYRGNKYALFIILPNSKGGLPYLISQLNLPTLKRQLHLMDQVSVKVVIPKLKFNFQARYTKILQNYGLRQMFQNTASFPGIARGHYLRLVVSDIIQNTGLELDEEGSTAFAATDVTIGNKFGDADNVFNATHPFLFFIEEQTEGTILFIGKVENPLEINAAPLSPRPVDDDDSKLTGIAGQYRKVDK